MSRRLALAVVVILAMGGFAIVRGMSPTAARTVPTVRVQRGRVQVTVYTIGDLRAARSVQLTVPLVSLTHCAREVTV